MSTLAQHAKAIFLEAVEQCEPAHWPALLDRTCGTDRELRQYVEDLLKAHLDQNGVIDRVDATIEFVAEQPGQFIGPYKLREKLGEGGFGVVWAAEQQAPIRRLVALKVIKPGMDTAAVIARFEAERQALAMMDHPGIAKVLDAGTTALGRPYFVMELIPGLPITDYCNKHAVDVRERLKLFTEVCRAVQHAHQKGLVHRDIKPSNVLVAVRDDRPVPKVIDFGVAKALHQPLTDKSIYTGIYQAIGTLAYMSPEQTDAGALDIDTRADIYGLGVVLYELLTGSTPFDKQRLESAAFREACRIIREEDPPSASTKVSGLGQAAASIAAERGTDAPRLLKTLRGDLDVILVKSLEKDRARRYDTANELARDIERYLNHEYVLARRPTLTYRLRKTVRRHAALVATSTIIVGALVTAVIGLGIGYDRSKEANRAITDLLVQEKESLAREQRLRAQVERQRYNRAMSAAIAALGDGDVHRVEELVHEVVQQQGDRPPEFELQFLQARLAENQPDEEYRFAELPLSAEYSPDGHFLAVGFGVGRVVLINRTTKDQTTLVAPYREQRMWTAFTPMKFSACGEYLVVGGADRAGQPEVRFWKWRSREPSSVCVKHSKPVDRIALSSNGLLGASGDADGRIKVWRMSDGHVLWETTGHATAVRGLEFSPDNTRLASVGLDHQVLLWDVEAGHLLANLVGHTCQLYSVAFTSDGKTLVSGGELRVKFWDLSGIQPRDMSTDVFQYVSELRFIPGEDILVTANGNGTVQLRDVRAQKDLLTLFHQGRVYGVAISPLGNQIACCGSDHRLSIWNWRERIDTDEIAASPGFHPPVAVCSTSNTVVFVGADNELQEWNLDADKIEAIVPCDDDVTALAVSPDDQLLAFAHRSGVIRLWNRQTKSLIKELAGHEGSIYGLTFSPAGDGRLASAGTYEEIRLWDIESGRSQILKKGPVEANAYLSVAISPDGKLLASVGPFGEVLVWDITGETPAARHRFPGSARAYGLVFSPNGKLLATTDDFRNGTITLCNLETGEKRTWKGHAAHVGAIAFSPSGNRLITGGADNSIKFWDVATAEEVGAIRTAQQVQRLMFLPDQKTLVSAGLAGYVRLYRTHPRNNQARATHE